MTTQNAILLGIWNDAEMFMRTRCLIFREIILLSEYIVAFQVYLHSEVRTSRCLPYIRLWAMQTN